MERYRKRYRKRYIETEWKQEIRERKRRRQKRTRLGLPASQPLRSIQFTQEQRVKLAAVQQVSHREQIKSSPASPRFSALCAIGLHFIAIIIGIQFLRSQVIDDDAIDDPIMVEMLEALPQRRRMPAHTVRRIEFPSTYSHNSLQIKPKITFAVEVPLSESALTASQNTGSIGDFPTLAPGNGNTLGNRKRHEMVAKPVRIAPAIPKTGIPSQSREPIISRLELRDLLSQSPELENLEEQVFALSEVTQKPYFVQKVAPEYPSLALAAEKTGTVWLEAIIGVDGIAGSIRVIQGIGYGCDEAAVEALRASRFAPARHKGKKVAVRVKLPYRFSLEDYQGA